MTAITATWNTSNFQTDEVKKSFAAQYVRYFPQGDAPLFALATMANQKRIAVATEHGFYTKTMVFPSALVNGTINSTHTTLTVNSTSGIVAGQLLLNNTTREIVRVTSVDSATQLTIARGYGTVAAANLTNATNMYSIGSAAEESSTRPTARAIQSERVTNQTQIFRNSWALSGSAAAVAVIVGDNPVAENRRDCAAFHASDIERAMWFSQLKVGTVNGQPYRQMNGIENLIQVNAAANVFTAGATTNYTQLQTYLEATLNQRTDAMNGNMRTIFTGGTGLRVLNDIARLNGTYQLNDGQTSFGLQFKQFKTARGTFNVVEHPQFNTNPDWSKMAAIVDLPGFHIAYLKGRETESKDYNAEGRIASDNGIDAIGGTLTTECTIELENPLACGLIYNLTAGAAG